MKELPSEILQFFQKQRFVIVSTIDADSTPHNSCKGVVDINGKGLVYLLDLYRGRTFANLKQNPNISITAVDEHKFVGYCLKGKAKIVDRKKLKPVIINAWEKKIAGRITHRLLKNMHDADNKGHARHPESVLPQPEYMIVMEASEIISLAPANT